jgi:hypothetical protein
MSFSDAEIKDRRLKRLAEMIYDHWEEKSGMDTRYFEHPYVNDVYTVSGQSKNGGEYREHVVPRAYLRDECFKLFDKGASIDEVASILRANLRVVKISNEEAVRMNVKYKTTMPEGWVLGQDCPLERLNICGVEIT